MVRLVIDTDPGVDDAHAILFALAYPGARVEALTTVSGNVPVDRTTANACKVLDAAGCGVPVYRGCSRAIAARHGHAEHVHGEDGLGDCGLPPSSRAVSGEHAVNALVRLGNENPGELTLVAIGPLTNIALATLLDPELPGKYRNLVLMGGAIHGRGNTTPSAEFNMHSDHEAAAVVFDSWSRFDLVSWETTVAHALYEKQLEEILALDTPRAEFFRRITGKTLQFIERAWGRRILLEADFLAVAAAVEPGVILKAERHAVAVERCGELTRGQTIVDWKDVTGRAPNANLVLEMDRTRLWELFKGALR
ncbi:MAG TPA: nucleoside hydrolase [Anaerolineaceae bacterium]